MLSARGHLYRYVASSLEGFVQQLAVSYFTKGYWFYVVGGIPERKDPTCVDEKILEKYQIAMSKWERSRRKEKGSASLQYLRYKQFFVILATHGRHPFFAEEENNIRDARKVPIKLLGYAISFRGGHPHVRIEQQVYNGLKAYLLDLAKHRSAETLAAEFRALPFEPYAPIRRQLFNILRAVNRARRAAGFTPVPVSCLRLKRRIVKPFIEVHGSGRPLFAK